MDFDHVVALVMQPHARSLKPLPYAPRLTTAAAPLVREVETVDELGARHPVRVPVERPLKLLVDGRELTTLWTLGARPEWLVAGYLLNQRWISDVSMLESISVDWSEGAAVTTRNGIAARPAAAATPLAPVRLTRTTLLEVLESVTRHESVYRVAGSAHGCALFEAGAPLISVEDVGRRNGVDTISGWMALHGVSGSDKVLFTTGRLTAEIVTKAGLNGVPVVVSRRGITGGCIELASSLGMMLFGHAASGRYLCYAGAERFEREA